jgi:hypothetical protein
MIDLEQFRHRTSDKYVVRHITDDSGDRTLHLYDIVAIMPYGQRTVAEGMDNPHDAAMFAAVPELIYEVQSLRRRIEDLTDLCERMQDVLEPDGIGES